MSIDKLCSHPRAVSWVECDYCKNWFHCLCTCWRYKNIKNMKFVCVLCIPNWIMLVLLLFTRWIRTGITNDWLDLACSHALFMSEKVYFLLSNNRGITRLERLCPYFLVCGRILSLSRMLVEHWCRYHCNTNMLCLNRASVFKKD